MTHRSQCDADTSGGNRPHLVDPPDQGTVMAVAAHPDDIESWCAGTIARAVDAGVKVHLLLVTSGDKGAADRSANPAEIAAVREREALEAARRLGLSEVVFLRQLDGEVENTRELRGEIVAWIRRWRPCAVFTHDPEHPYPPYLTHRDHRVVGRAALDAIYPLARDPLSFPDHLQHGAAPHIVNEVWLFSSMVATAYVDITAGFERKVHARLAHESQTADPVALAQSWATRAGDTGQPVGLECAEAFTVLRLT